mmetsp:Transcript_36964/g.83667  ORF Transcript_36964/g.83667 Transcript_36964/m.83667 type:complete len:207 (+) Transcript_36964:196-816(+)
MTERDHRPIGSRTAGRTRSAAVELRGLRIALRSPPGACTQRLSRRPLAEALWQHDRPVARVARHALVAHGGGRCGRSPGMSRRRGSTWTWGAARASWPRRRRGPRREGGRWPHARGSATILSNRRRCQSSPASSDGSHGTHWGAQRRTPVGPPRRARMPSSRAQLLFQWKGWSQQSVRSMGAQSSPSLHTTHAMPPRYECAKPFEG